MSLLRNARTTAISCGRSIGVVFERNPQGWRYQLYEDGDGDGIRTADIAIGTDPPAGTPGRVGERWEGVDFGFLPLARVRKVPPGSGWVASLGDPIQVGGADIVAFSPAGDGSSGTLYLSDGRTQMAAIVVYGPSARVRSYRYDADLEEWVL